jgi:predicted dienelactone hydrolase
MTMYRLPSFSRVAIALAAAFLAAAAPSRAARADAPQQSPTPQATPPSAEGKAERAVEIVAFPDLVDATRKSPTAAEARRPRLPRRNNEAPSSESRRVPIKVHVPSSGGPYPVIVVSHGAGGSWDTHHAQAQDLARHGYAVLCVEHIGSNTERMKQGLRAMKNIEAMTRDADEVLARPRDVSFAIDRAAEWNESHAKLKGRLDLARVGVMGHSFGAYTTMVACGMRPALDWLTPTVAPGKGLGPDLSDPRVKCGVALSPQSPGEPFFIAESFGSLRSPLLGITGSKDDQQAGKTAKDRKDSFALWPKGEHLLVWLANAQHLDFSDSSGSDDRALPSRTRADAQPATRAATRAFFDLHLKGDAAAAKVLTTDGLKPSLRGTVNSVEVLSK